MEGGDASNFLNGAGGNDTVLGGGGGDSLAGGHGNDTITGGAGEDTLIFVAGGGRTVNLNLTTAQSTGEGRDVITEFEHVIATNRDDAILGNGLANQLEGRDGHDVLAGGGGNDTLIGGYGNDTVSGGAGEDTLVFAGNSGGRAVNLSLTGVQATREGRDVVTAIEHVEGTQGNDFFTGNASANRLDGQAGDDVLSGGSGRDTLLGGAGNDDVNGGAGLDLLVMGGRQDTYVDLAKMTFYHTGQGRDRIVGMEDVQGGLGDDRFWGDATANALSGSAGRDFLDGRDGSDRLWGGIGNDTLRGGQGSDSFIFEQGDGLDFILGFDGRADLIIIRSGAEAYADLEITQVGWNVTISYGDDMIILDNVARASIEATDFAFV